MVIDELFSRSRLGMWIDGATPVGRPELADVAGQRAVPAVPMFRIDALVGAAPDVVRGRRVHARSADDRLDPGAQTCTPSTLATNGLGLSRAVRSGTTR
jgi:hypothetical protein